MTPGETRHALDTLVRAIVAETARADPATLGPATRLNEIGVDSLSLVSIAALVEASAQIELGDEAAERLFAARTLAELVELFVLAR